MAHNSMNESDLFVFGDFTVDPRQRLLLRGTEVVGLEPKVFDTLLALVQDAGRALAKDELLSRVWPDAFVEEGSLTRNISTLRKILATADNPQGYIETLSRRGYRFQPVVQRVAPGTSQAVPEPAMTVSRAAEVPVAGATRGRGSLIAATVAASLLVAVAAMGWWRGGDERAPITSIAVLPLQNLSGDPSQEFFSDGMTEAVISKLAQVTDVRVTSRTSVMRFKSTSASVPDIGRQLDVDAVVEGSVQREGDRIRVTVQLIHAETDSHLWAKEFEGTTSDVLDLQRRIALAIAGDISSKIAPARPTAAPERRLAAEAVDAYLLGRHLLWKTDLESKQRAVTELRKATALEPAFADAQAGLAMALIAQASFGLADSTGEALQVARKAVALDEHLAEAHAALAAAAFEAWDWETTQREFERALALFPNSEDACASYGLALSAFGRHDDAVAWAGRFASRNPVSAALHVNYAVVLMNARRYAEAERHLKLAIELEPRGFGAPIALAQVYTLTGRAEQAIPLLSTPAFANSTVLAAAYAAAGRRAEALAIVERVQQNPAPVDLLSIGMVHFHLGDADRGFQWLEQAVARRLGYVRWFNVHPAYDRWRNDPRFVALVRQLRLPATAG
ncbi:MAG TPA: winged helix-turn-helix domain-containing protein [Vicinamibacterales bacterium]|nr:winged helix-turn-helix domain-containing protein [Vicinamibacterales bacterium]